MKRDLDLIRRMLRDIESIPPGKLVRSFPYEDVDREIVIEHFVLLYEAGLVKGSVLPVQSAPPHITVTGLTWDGHDFLAAANNDTIWNKAKETILKPAAGATFGAVLEWLKAESAKALSALS